MKQESSVNRIVLAVESPALEVAAKAWCQGLLPGIEIGFLSLPEFEHLLDEEAPQDELRVLMLLANEHGQLDHGSPIVRSLMSSTAPVLVIRQSRGGDLPNSAIQRVVVPLDGSPSAGQAIPLASQVARALDVPVRFLMVIDPARVIPPAYAYDPEAWGMIESLRQTSHWALSQAEAAMKQDGVEVGSDLMFGSINATLCASIGEGDMVVMTTQGPGRQQLRARESVALRTLVSVPQPMLIVRARREAPIIVDAYQACSWAEPLRYDPIRTS